ncbi:MAG: DUF4143 domain-containing protein [Cellulomonadaceae bacterium]|nr:DUF4143 domain-containing protein [Cellulomonadaceae bacterium]
MTSTFSYLPRVADGELRQRLDRAGAVLIEGAKACGKTETASQQCASEVRLDIDETARVTASISPEVVLQGSQPRLLDEWQTVPRLWNDVRRAVDARRNPGQFVLTGSATPADDITRHTGAGRISRLRMRTLSMMESTLSSGTVSMRDLLAGGPLVEGRSELSLAEVIEETCHGGWPRDRGMPWKAAAANVGDYCAEVANADIRSVDGVRRDAGRVRLLMQSIARNTSTMARRARIAAEATPQLSNDTVTSYQSALERLMVLEPLPSWSPILRSAARLRTTAKHHFVDPAMSASLLNAGPDELRRDLKTFGFLFESLVLRDVRVYAQASNATVFHYRDSNNLEADFIIDGGYNRWGAVEVKLGSQGDVIDRAAQSLVAVATGVDTQSTGEPQFLAVVTAEGYAYTRPDGVHVIPIGVLGP